MVNTIMCISNSYRVIHFLRNNFFCLEIEIFFAGALDEEFLKTTVTNIKQGLSVQIPEYDYVNHCRYVIMMCYDRLCIFVIY